MSVWMSVSMAGQCGADRGAQRLGGAGADGHCHAHLRVVVMGAHGGQAGVQALVRDWGFAQPAVRVAGPAFGLDLAHLRAAPDGRRLEAAAEGTTGFTGDRTRPLMNAHVLLGFCALQADLSVGMRGGGAGGLTGGLGAARPFIMSGSRTGA